ncbi:MAG: aldose 1-epimerase family protein [Lachnospiraceae bacterium]|nr:aldose 1-epimerase family protein [Lachnospiraceae bacterium]
MRVTITSHGYEAVIESLGAELKSLKSPDGKEYIWNADPKHWMRSSPLLFPTIGNVRNNKTIIAGKEYSMPKHGFCKESEFTLLEQTENRAAFSLTDSPLTHESYPFSFELRLTYELEESKLKMTYLVINRDTDSMIYHIGAHPGFNCPLEEGEAFSDYVIEFAQDERLESYVYDLENMCFFADKRMVHGATGKMLKLSGELFDQDALYFYHTNSRSVALKNPVSGKGIRMDYPDFVSIAFWTPMGGNAPFLCLEPWNGSGIFEDEDDHFANKRDIQTLAAGKQKEYRLSISIL